MGQKREVPPLLKRILNWDITISKGVFSTIDKCSKCMKKANYDLTLSALEISGNGLIWLGVCTAAIFVFGSSWVRSVCVNLLLALIVDLVVVAVVKSAVRRRRPQLYQDSLYTVQAIDKFSFPSGHATRAVTVCWLLCHQTPPPFPLSLLLPAWAALVCLGRLALRRHYLLDVLAGCGIGLAQGLLLQWLWLSEEATSGVVAFLLNEAKQDAS